MWGVLGFAIDMCLHTLDLIKASNIWLARINRILCAEQHIVSRKSEKLGRHLGETMSNRNHIYLALATTNHQLVQCLFGTSLKIRTAVVEDNHTALEVMQHFHSSLWVEDMLANTVKHKVIFCPQFVHRVEHVAIGVRLVVLGIIGRDDKHTLTSGGTYLLDKGGLASTICTQDDDEFTRACLLRRAL